jgi:hypothetical protein
MKTPVLGLAVALTCLFMPLATMAQAKGDDDTDSTVTLGGYVLSNINNTAFSFARKATTPTDVPTAAPARARDSITYLTRVIRADPDYAHGTGYAQRGHAYKMKGDLDAAKFDFAEACKRGTTSACGEGRWWIIEGPAPAR